MIKIHDKLWWAINQNKGTLAYMTHVDTTKAFESRKSTGLSWANGYGANKQDYQGVEGDNTPQKGFYIGDSVSRWSTSNKLFRVVDPRGFTVEVPTGNIATLLHHTTVTKGVVMEECVWGKEGNNHILLPVNSEPYKTAVKDMDTLANKLIKVSELSVGDVVKFFNDTTEYTFIGRGKPTWEVSPYTYTGGWRHGINSKVDLETFTYISKVYLNIFSRKWDSGVSFCTYSNPKISEIIKNGDGAEYSGKLPQVFARGFKCDNHFTSKVTQVQWKTKKEKV